MRKITLGIDGMACGMCESHVNETVRQNFNVKKVTSDRKKKQTIIIADETISEEALKNAIDPTGYTVTSWQDEEYKKKGLFGF